MEDILYLVCVMSLLVITIQDFTQRLIWWFLFPLAGLSILLLKLYYFLGSLILNHVVINFSISGVLILIVILYIKIKTQGIKNTYDGFGLGDGLMFMVASLLFAPVQYLIFLVVCFVASLIYGLLVPLYFKKNEKSVPLAGVMSLFLTMILFVKRVAPGVFAPDSILTEIFFGGL